MRLLVKSSKYTLDRFEGNYAIFLKRPDETEQLIIELNKINVQLHEGDIVEIIDTGFGYSFKKLEADTRAAEDRVKSLLNKLRDKNQ